MLVSFENPVIPYKAWIRSEYCPRYRAVHQGLQNVLAFRIKVTKHGSV